jgi:hypothetical protein
MMRTIAVRIDPAALESIHTSMVAAGLPRLTDEQAAELAIGWGLREVQDMYGFLAKLKAEAPAE